MNENQTLVHPASAASLPTSADQEDYVSMGPWAGAKLRHMITNARTVIAIEWLVAGQALELRHPLHGGRGSEAALRALREGVKPWGRTGPRPRTSSGSRPRSPMGGSSAGSGRTSRSSAGSEGRPGRGRTDPR